MCIHEIVEHISCKFHWNRTDIYCVRDFQTCNWGDMRNQVSDKAISWHNLMQRFFGTWKMKCQYLVKSPRAANTARTRRWQLCIKRRIDAWGMSFHIRWISKRKSATLRMMVLGLFNSRLKKSHTFSIGFKSGLLLGQSKTSTASRRSRSLVIFAVCGVAPSSRSGTVFDALRVRPIPGEDTLYCPFGNIKGPTNGCTFHTRLRHPYYTPSLSFGRPPHGSQAGILPVKLSRKSEFMGHCFVTTGSIPMKHGRNWVGMSISRCRNFHKNIRSFTEINKSLKTNLILKNKVVSHLERGTHWVKDLITIFVL